MRRRPFVAAAAMNQLDQDEKLIIEVQQYPGLYDQNSYDYRDLRKKENMWQKVADALGLHGESQRRRRVLRHRLWEGGAEGHGSPGAEDSFLREDSSVGTRVRTLL